MKQKDPHIDKDLFSRLDIPYRKSKEEVWDELSPKLSTSPKRRIIFPEFRFRYYGAAATVLILISVFSVVRFRSVTVSTGQGERITATLPDGSTIDMNASSELHYHPYWWRISRKVTFEGEAFFMVRQGSSFRVYSNSGITEVLGTSFNIFSRFEKYRVTCMTGKVKVYSRLNDTEAILLPYEEARLNREGNFEIVLVKEKGVIPAWKENYLKFTSMPLRDVIDEVERQYNVVILTPDLQELVYTGNFGYQEHIETVLSLICKPLGLEYVKKSDAEYIIVPISRN